LAIKILLHPRRGVYDIKEIWDRANNRILRVVL
jgi:hypothetical protein